MDFTTSGWTTPRRFPAAESAYAEPSITSDLLARRTERLLSTATTMAGDAVGKQRLRLEDKVAKVAAKKCSVEEVAALHKELEDWLLAEKEDQVRLLFPFDVHASPLPGNCTNNESYRHPPCTSPPPSSAPSS